MHSTTQPTNYVYYTKFIYYILHCKEELSKALTKKMHVLEKFISA